MLGGESARGGRRAKREKSIKTPEDSEGDLRPEYDLSQLRGGGRGKHLEAYRAGTNLALPASDVRAAFPTDEAAGPKPSVRSCKAITRPRAGKDSASAILQLWTKMKATAYVNLLLGALPLLIYPVVFLADVMSLAGHRDKNAPAFLSLVSLVALSFILGSLAYPLVYISCWKRVGATFQQKKERLAVWISIIPLAFLLLLALLLKAWASLG
jgi:hypothetical protein